MKKSFLFSFSILLVFSVSAFSKIGILVNSDFYPEIREAILTYAKDVELIEKKSVWIDSTSFSDEWLKSKIPEQDLRDTLINHWKNDSLEGAVLIGNFPIVELHKSREDYGATQVYYMDLDGRWSGRTMDDSGSIKYQKYLGDENGTKKMEIWISLVIPSIIAGVENNLSEKEITDSYFDRVHKRMWGISKAPKSAYTISNDWNLTEWKFFRFKSQLAKNYYSSVFYEYQPSIETYKKRLQGGDYDIACIMAHSTATIHLFGNNTYFRCKDLLNLNPPSKIPFFIGEACSNHDIRQINMGTAYALWGGGLLSFGTSVPYPFRNESRPYFFNPLYEGKSFGEAFLSFYNDAIIGSPTAKYYILQGVGTLRLLEYPEYTDDVALVEEVSSLSNNKINMNYSNGLLSISKIQSNTNQPVEIKLFTLNGKNVMNLESQLENGKLKVSLNSGEYGNISKGLYLCKVFIGNEEKVLLINTANK